MKKTSKTEKWSNIKIKNIKIYIFVKNTIKKLQFSKKNYIFRKKDVHFKKK